MPGFNISDEHWEEQRKAGEKAFEMTFAGLGLVLISLIFGGINALLGVRNVKRQREREDRLDRDLSIALEGKAAAKKLWEDLKSNPDHKERLLTEYKKHHRGSSDPWIAGFFGGLPITVRNYITEQYQQHPEWGVLKR